MGEGRGMGGNGGGKMEEGGGAEPIKFCTAHSCRLIDFEKLEWS